MFDYIVARLAREGMSPTQGGRADGGFKGRRVHGLRSAMRRALVAAHAAELAAFDAAAYIEVIPATQYLGAGDYAPMVTVTRL